MFKRANNLTDHILQWELTTTVQAINNYCMGIISFSETHINYKIELRLIPMHRLMYPPPRERQLDTHGECDTFENSVGFPTHKQIFGVQNSLVGHHIC